MSSDAVKRIMAEVRELAALASQPNPMFHAAPLESDLFEWHFTVRGPPDTPFANGLYHGRILLPAEYPLKAPEIILLTPNGRFEVGTRICLSVTSHHNETWQPSWGIRTILTALVGFMPSKSEGLGALDYPAEHRRVLAKKSLAFACPRCGARPVDVLPHPESAGDGDGDCDDSAYASASSSPPAPAVAVPSTTQQTVNLATQADPVNATQARRGEAAPPRRVQTSDGAAQQGAAVRSRAQARRRARVTRTSRNGQERELLLLAYAIGFAIVAILVRRVVQVLQ